MKKETVVAYKGFARDWTCQGGGSPFQFEIGKTYKHDGKVKACNSGFHSCEYPLDVFSYYEPDSSVYAEVEASGDIDRHVDDTKLASRSLTVKAAIDIPGLVKAAIEFVTTKCEPVKAKHSTRDSSASSATGYRSASSATGYSSASSATGYRSASLTTGNHSSSEVIKDDSYSVAIGAGYQNKARAAVGCALVLTHRNDVGHIVHIRASKVGDNGIKPMVWYELNAKGEFQEAA